MSEAILGLAGLGEAIPSVKVSVPSVTVFGCGGCGINLVRFASGAISDHAIIKLFDTSHANTRSGEQVRIIARSGNGSGKNRQENADPIVNEISQLSNDEFEISDVNIVVFSMSGGSGSVLGPVILREIARRARPESLGPARVVAIVVSDTITEKSTTNTLNTLKTLEAITQKSKLYLPISIFDNISGQRQADIEAGERLAFLVQILTDSVAEVDRNDRRNWLNASDTVQIDPGLRILHITVGDRGSERDISCEYFSGYEGYFFDSCLNMRTQDKEVTIPHRTRVTFNGILTNTAATVTPMLGTIGNRPDAFSKLVNSIQQTLTEFSAQSRKHKAVIDVGDDETNEHGLVL